MHDIYKCWREDATSAFYHPRYRRSFTITYFNGNKPVDEDNNPEWIEEWRAFDVHSCSTCGHLFHALVRQRFGKRESIWKEFWWKIQGK